jgi:hypothetical protein
MTSGGAVGRQGGFVWLVKPDALVGEALLGYLAIAVFGGFAQLFSTVLIHPTSNPNAPAINLIFCGVVSLSGRICRAHTGGTEEMAGVGEAGRAAIAKCPRQSPGCMAEK